MAPILFWRDKQLFSPDTIREGMGMVWDLPLEERYRPAKLGAAIRKRRASRKAASMLRALYDRDFRRRILEDVTHLAMHLNKSTELKTGALGFSMGGKLAMQLAASFRELKACVAYSAEPVDLATVGEIRSPIMLLYGRDDAFMTRKLPEFVRDSMKSDAELTLKVYPSAGHEFFDETDLAGYGVDAATDAWKMSMDFFRRNLSD